MVDVWLHAVPISLICSSEASVISFAKCRDLFHESCEENNRREKTSGCRQTKDCNHDVIETQTAKD